LSADTLEAINRQLLSWAKRFSVEQGVDPRAEAVP
jgi:hypothetical protein